MNRLLKRVFLPLGLLLSAGVVVLFVVLDRSSSSPKDHSPTSDFGISQHPVLTLASSLSISEVLSLGSVVNAKGEEVPVPFTVDADPAFPGKVRIEITPLSDFPPGKYKFVLNDPHLKISQDFSWGVLAINPDRAVYLPGQEVNLGMAVLDEKGGMVCDGILSLDIVSPGGKTTTLSLENGLLIRNPECWIKDIVDKPDYQAKYTPHGQGTYRMYLSAETPNGTYRIQDSFTVASDVPFDVRRSAPTRIYPLKAYPVRIDIVAQTDFTGTVTESLPPDLLISDITPSPSEALAKEGQTLSWNISLKKGQKTTLEYTFDAPDVSPYFYLLGPLSFKDTAGKEIFSEPRQWQVASDDLTSLRPDGNGTYTGWTSTTCNGTGESAVWGCINEDPDSPDDTDYISGPNVSDSTMFVTLSNLPSDALTVTSLDIKARHRKIMSGNDAITMGYQIYTGGESTALTAESTTAVTTTWATATYSSVSITGTNTIANWNAAYLRISQDWAKASGTDASCYGQVSAVEVNVTYTALTMTQRGFILENDDGATVNANSNLAETNATASSILRGQRLIGRMKLENTGASTQNFMYQLQYSADGSTWHNVATGSGAPSGNSANTSPNYTTSTVDDPTNVVGEYTSIAIGTDGYPVISYYDDGVDSLKVAKCNDPACSGGDEIISTVDIIVGTVGYYTSIAIGTDGYPVISYQAQDSGSTNYYLKVAKCVDIACSTAITPTTVEDPTDYVGYYTSLAIGTDGYPVISYQGKDSGSTNYYLKVAKCNDPTCAGGDETITTVEDITNAVGLYTSLAIGTDGYPVISYKDMTASSLKVAKYSPVTEINATL